jgi:photosystem II stability/assembly factor-like uncharacterized protein
MRTTLLLLTVFALCLSSQAQRLDMGRLKNLNIRNVGPSNMSGRITAIDVVTSDAKIIYVGAASGGVWKSENGGSAWQPVFDDQPTQNIGAIAIDQSNPSTIWVGTGEGNPRNSMNLGMGLFKSLDAGQTWQHVGLAQTKVIHRIIIDPADPQTVYVGAMGDPFTPNEHRGLFKTHDGGKTWSKVLFSNDRSGIADLVMDPANPKKLFAALYEHRRTPYYFTSGGSGSGLYVTYDGGETWKQIGARDGLPPGALGRIGIAIAPSNSNRVYAKVEATKNALYRSDDGGKQWYLVNDDPKFTNNRPFYFQDLAVDSWDANRLYNIYQPLSVSYDGGKTFDPIPMIPADETKGIHADFHAFWVNPNDPQHFIIGGDGGLGITFDHGASWYFPESIPVAQFYHINADNDTPYNVYGGMQDNGNWSGPGYVWKRGGIRSVYWQYLVGGDGFYISPDVTNSRFGYGTSQNGDLYRYDKLTGYYQSIKPPSPDLSTHLRFNWNAAFSVNPFNSNSAYYGSQFVHVTHDKGATWEIISPDLTTNNPDHQKADYGGLTLDVSGAEVYNSILTIAPSPLDSNLIWVGTDDGQVQLTRDGGKTWLNLTGYAKNLPKESWITQIRASQYDVGTAWMVVNNYRKGDYAPYLFKTENFGKTWSRLVDQNKVTGYALTVLQDAVEPNLVFLGTENGLWISIDKGNSWVQFKNKFPSVSTMDLALQESESALIVGTFGRAIWILDDLKSLRFVASGKLNTGLQALPVNDVVQVKGLFIAPPGNIWTGFHTTFEGENRDFQRVRIPFFVSDKSDTCGVNVVVLDELGRTVNTLTPDGVEMGLNYVVWKLDEKAALLPGAWQDDESRGIPVLAGTYKAVIHSCSSRDSTLIRIKDDPRFETDPDIEKQLYAFRKRVDREVNKLSSLLNNIDRRKASLDKLKKYLTDLDLLVVDPPGRDSLVHMLSAVNTKLDSLRALGQTPRPARQVGAWQSFQTSPYSKLQDALRIASARTVGISAQEKQVLTEASTLIMEFEQAVEQFNHEEWKTITKAISPLKLSWLED